MCVELAHRCQTQRSLFGQQIGLVISPYAVLVTDGSVQGDDRPAGSRFEEPRLLNDLCLFN